MDVIEMRTPRAGDQDFVGIHMRDAAGFRNVMTASHTKAMHHHGSAEAQRLRTRIEPLITTTQVRANHGGCSGAGGRLSTGMSCAVQT